MTRCAVAMLALLALLAGPASRAVAAAPIHAMPTVAVAELRALSRPMAAAVASNLIYHGGPVMHRTVLRPVFWAPAGFAFPAGYEAGVVRYLADVAHDSGGAGNVFATTGEFDDGVAVAAYDVSLATTIDDSTPYPPSGCAGSGTTCVVAAAMSAEAVSAGAARSIPPSLTDLWLVFLPPNVTSCFDSSNQAGVTSCSGNSTTYPGWCGAHSYGGTLARPTLVGLLPYAGTGCGTGPVPNGAAIDHMLGVVSHEVSETITDPLVNAWYSSANGGVSENGDNCAYVYGATVGGFGISAFNQVINGHPYMTQEEWVNDGTGSCVQTYQNPLSAGLAVPAGVPVGTPVMVNGGYSTDAGGVMTRFSFSFADGSPTVTGPSAAIMHTFARPGPTSVSLIVNGSVGVASGATALVDVTGVVAALTSPPSALTLGAVTFDASATLAEPAVSEYRWDFGDGTLGTSTTPTTQHVYARPGSFPVTVTAVNADGEQDTARSSYVALDRPPVAAADVLFTVDPVVAAGDALRFDGGQSIDPDGSIVAYEWDFGDGTVSTGPVPVALHAYARAGVFVPRLRVTDDVGTATDLQLAPVAVVPGPVAAFVISGPAGRAVIAGDALTFDAGPASDPEPPLTYSWSFGDGSAPTQGQVAAHAFGAPGQVDVALTIVDAHGRSASTTRTVAVLPAPPIPLIVGGSPSLRVGARLRLDASTSTDVDARIVSYTWTFGDGGRATGAIVAHAWLHRGTYTVTLVERDDRGVSATATRTVKVAPALACVVPNVRGLALGAARNALLAGGCAIGQVTRARSRRVHGTVLATTPSAGRRRFRTGTRVSIVVAA